MPKMTKKYKMALQTATRLGNPIQDRERLYSWLNSQALNWSPKTGTWDENNPRVGSAFEDHNGMPTGHFKIRLMAHSDEMRAIEEIVIDALREYGCHCYTTSDEDYKNRNGVGVRIYMEGQMK